ncbi:signal peptidase I [Candidatus Woesearchaeota archaeon]|nr:signal peptidase I [Candidatus Woesearchaeota archaeon]
MKKNRPKKKSSNRLVCMLKRIWHFLWEEDSLASWIVNIILAFVLIKFVIYPGLGLAMGTTHPVVAVVSGSMEHKTVHPCVSNGYSYVNGQLACVEKDNTAYEICGKEYDEKQHVDLEFFWESCGGFYSGLGITEEEFGSYDFKNGFNTGDIIILRGIAAEDIEKGDVIVFQATKPYPIIHRVVEKRYEEGELLFATKGDHNARQTEDDIMIKEESIIGKAVLRVPYLGWVKIAFFKLLDWVGILKLVNYINAAF